LERIHAFQLPKYYSFGLKSALNTDFMVNELYNSMKKTVSLRISSRKKSSLPDSTLKVIDLNIPVSSIVHLGFIETFTNVIIVVNSSYVSLIELDFPVLKISGIITNSSGNPIKNFVKPTEIPYCVKMGSVKGEGTIMAYPKSSRYTSTPNRHFPYTYYMNLYDPYSSFLLNDVFLGSNLALSITPNEGSSKILQLLEPL
jgi:hypothetical protein